MTSTRRIRPGTLRRRHTTEPVGRCVLVATRDPTCAEQLEGVLAADGYDVAVASASGDVLKLVRNPAQGERINLLIVDVSTEPWMGLSLLEGLRSGGSVLPVILLVAPGDSETQEQGRDLGADGLLGKPAAPGSVRCLVRRLAPLECALDRTRHPARRR